MRMIRATMVSILMEILRSYLEVEDEELLFFASLYQTSLQKTQTLTLQIQETEMEVLKVLEDIRIQERQEDTQDTPANLATPAEEDIQDSRVTQVEEDIQMMTMADIQATLLGDIEQLNSLKTKYNYPAQDTLWPRVVNIVQVVF